MSLLDRLRAAVAPAADERPLTLPNQSRESAYERAMDAAERRYDQEVAEIERKFAQ